MILQLHHSFSCSSRAFWVFTLLTIGIPHVLAGQPASVQAELTDTDTKVKLIDSEKIIGPLEQGKETIRVIVNLVEPIQAKVTNWRSLDSAKARRDKVRTTQARVLSTLDPSDFTIRYRFENQAGFSAEVNAQGLAYLLGDPRVESIEPVREVELDLKQGIPLMKADTYRSTYDGSGIAIAICDSGVDYTHPKLGGGGFPNQKVIGGYDFGEHDPDPLPKLDLEDQKTAAHGTACAGIVAGDPNDPGEDTGAYIGGVAPGAALYALKISFYTDSVVAAWDWCVTHQYDDPNQPIMVISNSFSKESLDSAADLKYPAESKALANAAAAGIVVVGSAGNSWFHTALGNTPAFSNVISVGAVYDSAIFGEDWCRFYPIKEDWCIEHSNLCENERPRICPVADLVPYYSNSSAYLDLLAPANNAYTTDISGRDGWSTGDYWEDFGGTSAACPYVAGAVASLQSAALSTLNRYLTPTEVRELLVTTGDDVIDPKSNITTPRVNLKRAIESISRYLKATSTQDTQEFFLQGGAYIIPDSSMLTSQIIIPESGQIEDLDIRLNISHTWVEDLKIVIIGPDGTRIGLLSNVGGDGDHFYETILDDSADITVADGTVPFRGRHAPEEKLEIFKGKSMTGPWTLEVTDTEDLITGSLNAWSLIVTYTQTPGCSDSSIDDVNSYPHTTDFESDSVDWIDCDTDDLDWLRDSEDTPSDNTGPASAHAGDYYRYLEASDPNNPSKMAVLEGPIFDLNDLSWPVLRFWYHMRGADMGSLHVDLSRENNTDWTEIWRYTEERDDQWHEAVVSLAEYAQTPVRLRFKGITGSGYAGDIAIDDIFLGEFIGEFMGEFMTPTELVSDVSQIHSEVPQWFSFDVHPQQWTCIAIDKASGHDLKVYSSPEELFLISAKADWPDFIILNGNKVDSGSYFAQVFGGSAGDYVIEAQSTTTNLSVGSTKSDSFSENEIIQVYKTALSRGEPYTIELTIDSGVGCLLIYVISPDQLSGSPFNFQDGFWDCAGDELVARKSFDAPISGYYGIVIVKYSGAAFDYRLSVSQ